MQKSLMSFIICVLAYVRTLMAILFQFRLFFSITRPFFWKTTFPVTKEEEEAKSEWYIYSILFFYSFGLEMI